MTTSPKQSRRSILQSAIAATAGWVAASVAKPAQIAAGSGDPITMDQTTTGTGTTKVVTTSPAAPVGGFVAQAIGPNGAIGVTGEAEAVEGKGVIGYASDTSGPVGPFGVWGETHSVTGVGVLGYTGSIINGTVVYPTMGVGVYGFARQDASVRGVWGTTTAGTGVYGDATTGTGVRAVATSGVALGVNGRVTLSRSGRAAIAKNRTYVDVFVAGGLSASALVIATLQTYRGGASVGSVRLNYPTTGYVRIYLTKVASTTSTTIVAWIAIG